MKTFICFVILMLGVGANVRATSPGDDLPEYDADKLSVERVDYSLFDRYNMPYNSFGRTNNFNFSFISNNRRGYDLAYNQIYLDNLLLNDAVSGRALWSLLPLLRKADIVDFADEYSIDKCRSSNPFSYGEHYVIDPGNLGRYTRAWIKTGTTAKGSSIGYITNGDIGSDWKFSCFLDLSMGRSAEIPSVNGLDMKLSVSAQRMFKNNRRLIVALFFDIDSTTMRLPITRTAAQLCGDNLYNPAWGWHDGRRRSSRMKTETTLVPVIKYIGRVSSSSEIDVALSGIVRTMKRGALAWFDALDPRPDYYRYMPGFIGNGYVDDQAGQSWVDNSQIDWKELYGANLGNSSAKYIIEDRHENIANAQIAVSVMTRFDQHLTLGYGVRGRIQRTSYFKKINDLLGASGMYDIDRYLIDNELYGDKLHNNVREKDKFLKLDDKFGYNYRLTAQNAEAFAELRYDTYPFLFKFNSLAGNVGYHRVGNFEKELFEGNLSYGKSKRMNFNTMSVAAEMLYKPAVHHSIELKAMYSSNAPAATSLFISPQYRNEMVDKPKNVTMSGGQVRYGYIGKRFNISFCGYYTAISNGSNVYSYYDDLEREYCDMYMYNTAQNHYGAEISAELVLSTPLSFQCSAVVGSHKYVGNPEADIKRNTDGKSVVMAHSVDLDGFNVGNVAGCLFSAGVKYNRNLWIASLTANVAADRYVEPSPLRRMPRMYLLVRGDDMFRNFVSQEKLPTSISANLFLQKTFRVGRNENYITVYTAINNIFGYEDNIFSAYEPMRVRRSAVGTIEKYTPMESGYLYSNARSFQLSCDYKRDDDALPVCDNRSEIVTVDILRKWCVSAPFVVDNDVAVEGVVVANDRGGNFNKTFVIQSDMGGVEVLAGFYSLSTNYPVGRNLHLQLKGLTIEMRNGLITAGVASGYDNHARPDYFFYPYLLRQHICGDYKMTLPEVLLVSASDLKNELCGKLVQINGLKYSGDSKCWGDGDIPHSFHTNDHIVPMVMIRTSKYCDFAQGYIPSGIVNIRGILYKEMVAGAPYFVIKPINISDIETM